MTKFSFYKISKYKENKIFKKCIKKTVIYIVFLHGFMSDLRQGKNQIAFLKFAKKNKLGFLH